MAESQYSSEDYQRATKLNAALATSADPSLVAEARELAGRMLDHIRGEIEDFEGFVRRVHLSEQFSLTEAMQFKKKEKELKVIYTRAQSLSELAVEASVRAKKQR